MSNLLESIGILGATLLKYPWGIAVILLGYFLIKWILGLVMGLMAIGPKAWVIVPVSLVLTFIGVWFFISKLPFISGYVGNVAINNWIQAAQDYNVPAGSILGADKNPFNDFISPPTNNSTSTPFQPDEGSQNGKYTISHPSGTATVRNLPGGLVGGGDVLQEIPNGTTVNVVEWQGDWAKIDSPIVGWLHVSTLITFQGP